MNYLNNLKNKIKETKLQKEKQLAQSVVEDFKRRQEERKPFEAQWQLNMNFLMGNQYMTLSGNGEVEEFDKQFFWQQREVFNHIAPLVEIRLAKLSRIRPEMTVVPASAEDKDVAAAKLSKKILKFIQNSKNISHVLSQATKWSEICGTAFYKVTWNGAMGEVFAKDENGVEIKDGDVEISCITPFEIFPESSTCQDLEDCQTLICAKALPVSHIFEKWGVSVDPEEINVFSLSLGSGTGGLGYNSASSAITSSTRNDCALVIEKYTRPCKELPNGRLTIVCQEKVLFDGDLPYVNAHGGKRDFPFVRQTALENAGCFWGASIIERVIPIQRAYNAVKNRKHEFLNRISMGVLTVEDGSVDVENLEDEGLSPGKILIYRQGSNPPTFMSSQNVPTDFTLEEDRLLNEFLIISGVSDLMRSTTASATNLSGTALQLLMEQDDTRMSFTIENMRSAIRCVGEQCLRLYKQFAIVPKLAKICNREGDVETLYFMGSQINADDVVFETEQEASQTIAQKRSMVFDLLSNGLLSDDEGKISMSMKTKVLEMLGFGVWEGGQDVKELHMKKAQKENLEILKFEKAKVCEIDDHDLHINEHIAFMLSDDYEKHAKKHPELEEMFLTHIRSHKKMRSLSALAEGEINNN